MTSQQSTPTAVVVLLALAVAPVGAQTASLEVRGSLPRAVGEFGEPGGIEASGDAGFGADLFFSLSPRFAVYGGYGQDGFGCKGCADDDVINARGFEAGARLLLASDSPVAPWIRGGITFQELSVDRGTFEATSDAGLGFQAGAGLDIPLGRHLSFTPALRYQRWEAGFDVVGDALVAQEEVSYLALDLAAHLRPGR